MKAVGLIVILLGLAGIFVFSKPSLRWESAGSAIVGIVLIVIAARSASR